MRGLLLLIGGVLIGVVIVLVGEGLDNSATARDREFYKCKLSGFKKHSDDYNKATSFMQDCMGTSGYEIDPTRSDALCKVGGKVLPEAPFWVNSCYDPMGSFSKWRQRFAAWLLR